MEDGWELPLGYVSGLFLGQNGDAYQWSTNNRLEARCEEWNE